MAWRDIQQSHTYHQSWHSGPTSRSKIRVWKESHYIVMAYVVIAYIAMADVVIAYLVMAYIVMADTI